MDLMAAWSYCTGGGGIIVEAQASGNNSTAEKSTSGMSTQGVPPTIPDDPNYCYSSNVRLVDATGYVVKAY